MNTNTPGIQSGTPDQTVSPEHSSEAQTMYRREQREGRQITVILSLLALVVIGSAVSERTLGEQAGYSTAENESVAKYCRQTGGRYTNTSSPKHSICCYDDKCLHLDIERGVSEIIFRIENG